MTDVGATIAPRSDQLNSDDLLAGPVTITITRVTAGNTEQPINVHYEGDGGKPYKPGKSMRRVLVNFWGRDGESYVGRRLTLYRDPNVQFGGIAVGGIRISHMSHIGSDGEMALAVTKGSKRIFKVKPLRDEGQGDPGLDTANKIIARIDACPDLGALEAEIARDQIAKRREWLSAEHSAQAERVDDAIAAKRRSFDAPVDTGTSDNPTAAEGPDDTGRGEDHVEDETPAWRPAVDAHLTRIRSVALKTDVDMAIMDFSASKEALPDEAKAEVDDAEHNALMRFSAVAGG